MGLERRTDRPLIRCTAVLAGARTDSLSTTQPPTLTDRSSTTALTDNLLSAFATTNTLQTPVSTDHFLGAFGRTNNLAGRVQELDAEPANFFLERNFPHITPKWVNRRMVSPYHPKSGWSGRIFPHIFRLSLAHMFLVLEVFASTLPLPRLLH